MDNVIRAVNRIFKASTCGAGKDGAPGFQPGNTCGKEDGSGDLVSYETSKKITYQKVRDSDAFSKLDHGVRLATEEMFRDRYRKSARYREIINTLAEESGRDFVEIDEKFGAKILNKAWAGMSDEDRLAFARKNVLGEKSLEEVAKFVGCTDLAAFVGAPDGSEVTVALEGETVRVSWVHKDSNGYRIINPRDKVVEAAVLEVKKSSEVRGYQILAKMASEARRAGYRKITTTAAQDMEHVGAIVWPLLGYNARIDTLDEKLQKKIRQKYPGVEDLQDLLDLPGGRQFWKGIADWCDLEFDLSDGSKSMRRIQSYVKAKKND